MSTHIFTQIFYFIFSDSTGTVTGLSVSLAIAIILLVGGASYVAWLQRHRQRDNRDGPDAPLNEDEIPLRYQNLTFGFQERGFQEIAL